MSQATMEQPRVKSTESRTSSLTKNQRQKILLQLSELQLTVTEMVDAEMGNCVGRVLEHAGSILSVCANQFEAQDKKAEHGYMEMLEADSFLQAAAALAAQDVTARGTSGGRALVAARLAAESAAITTALDSYLVDVKQAAKLEPAPETSAAESSTQPVAAAESRDTVTDAANNVATATSVLQLRLQDLNSSAAYGVRSLMNLAEASLHEAAETGAEDDYDTANCDLGNVVAMLSMVNEKLDDASLYGVEIILEKASATFKKAYEAQTLAA